MMASDKPELEIVRTFDAPAALVFSMWSDPEHFAAWMGPEGFSCPVAEIDFREGGAYRALIVSKDQGESWFSGVYREIAPHTRLAFTFAWNNTGPSAGLETLITLTFSEQHGRTIQTFHQVPFLNNERRDSHHGGWASAFEKLAHHIRVHAAKRAPVK